MTTKAKAIAGSVVLLAVFLIGFVPQYAEKARVRGDLEASKGRVISLESDLRMAEMRDLCGLMLLETLRQNYGLARDYSTQYFETLRQVAEEQQDPTRKQALQELSARRDSMTALLANSDPASSPEIQAVCGRTYEVSKR